MIRIVFVVAVLLAAIGCAPDVELNPTAAGVQEFRDTIEAYDELRERERDALPGLSESATARAIAEHAIHPPCSGVCRGCLTPSPTEWSDRTFPARRASPVRREAAMISV